MSTRWAAVAVVFFAATNVAFANSSLSHLEQQEYDLAISHPSWASPPSDNHRLYLDIYNVTDFYDFETNNSPGYVDGTWLADTLRPTATILWDERFRIQLGLIALRGYGDDEGYRMVDPWIQLLWQPTKPISVVLGNLDIPHYYLPQLFFPLNYVRDRITETGAQVLFRSEHWYDDLFFDYELQNTPEHNEKFTLGFVHANAWKWLRFNYQSHWVHEGGTLYPNPVDTINDVAQTAGLGVHAPLGKGWVVGADAYYLHSHYRQDANSAALDSAHNGSGNYYEGFARWGRIKGRFGYWQGHSFTHASGDKWFELDLVRVLGIRFDIVQSRDFNLMLDYTGYFIGDTPGIDRYAKTQIHLQAAWQFSIPIMTWSTPSASPKEPPWPARWDSGI